MEVTQYCNALLLKVTFHNTVVYYKLYREPVSPTISDTLGVEIRKKMAVPGVEVVHEKFFY